MSQPNTTSPTHHPDGSRRQFLVLALLSSGAVLGARLAFLGLEFAQPVAAEGEYGGVFNLGLLTDLPKPGEPPLHVPAGRFYLVQTDEGVLALRQVCTHLDCLLGWDGQSQHFLCPCHGSQFAADGQVLAGPANRSLERFSVRLATVDGAMRAETDATSGAALPVAEFEASETSADGSDTAPGTPGLIVWVDTGQRIAPSASR